MEIFNNWFVQGILGNIAFYLLTRFGKWLLSDAKTNSQNNSNRLYNCSKKSLRKQFYFSLVALITLVPLFFMTTNNYLKIISIFGILFSLFFIYCAFECSLDSLDDDISNRSK